VSDSQMQYALEQLKSIQRRLQETSKEDYWVQAQGISSASGQATEAAAAAGTSEYWMPNGNLDGVDEETTNSLTDLSDSASKQRYWLPDGVKDIPSPMPDTVTPDMADPKSSYWVPNGVTAPNDPVPIEGLDADSSEAIQQAIKDIMGAMDTPVGGSPASPVDGPSPEESVEQVVGAVQSIQVAAAQDHGVKTMLQTVNDIGERLTQQLKEAPGLGSVPLVGRVLGYLLAAAGVAYLMREAFLQGGSGEEADGNSGVPVRGEQRSKAAEPIDPEILQDELESVVAAASIEAGGGGPLDGSRSAEQQVKAETEAEAAAEAVDVGMPGEAGALPNGNGFTVPPTGVGAVQRMAPSAVEEPRPVLPWMDDDPAGWGFQEPATDGRGASLNVHAPDPALSPARSSQGPAAKPSNANSPQDPVKAAGKDDQRAQEMDALADKRRISSVDLSEERGALKEKLWWVVRGLGPTAAIVPGGEPIRNDIDSLISKLEELTPLETPLNTQTDAEEYAYLKVRSKAHPHLLGLWRLEYASNSEVVQQNVMQQFLQIAEALPGFGVGDVMQQLSCDLETDDLLTENTAIFGLGPFGSWQISVNGVWADNGGGICAKASFSSFAVRPVEIMGFPADALPEVRVPVPAELQAEVEWCTTYCDRDFRVGRGTLGNLFVFRKEKSRHFPSTHDQRGAMTGWLHQHN